MAGRAIDDFETVAIHIRIDISSSDFPQYSVHSNYPGVWSEQGDDSDIVIRIIPVCNGLHSHMRAAGCVPD